MAVRQGKVTGHGVPGAPRGGGPIPGLDVDRTEQVHRRADGQQHPWVSEPLGVETRPALMDVTSFERPWEDVAGRNTGEHGQVLPPDHPMEGEQTHQAVYPVAPIQRDEPASWAEPLIRRGGPAPQGGESIPGVS